MKLRPCPFCGSEAELIDNRLSWHVRCTKCRVVVIGTKVAELESEADVELYDWNTIKQSAIDRWNTRFEFPLFTFTRSSSAIYQDKDGVMREYAIDEPRIINK